MSQERPANELVGSCSIETLEKASKDPANPNGILAIFTQPNCEPCVPFIAEAKNSGDGKLAIVEVSVEDSTCMDTATKMKVTKTPTAVYMKDGKEVARITTDGKTWEDIRKELSAVLKPQAPEPVHAQEIAAETLSSQ